MNVDNSGSLLMANIVICGGAAPTRDHGGTIKRRRVSTTQIVRSASKLPCRYVLSLTGSNVKPAARGIAICASETIQLIVPLVFDINSPRRLPRPVKHCIMASIGRDGGLRCHQGRGNRTLWVCLADRNHRRQLEWCESGRA